MGISLEVVLAIVCAVTFFRAGRFESDGEAYDYSFVWSLMSVLLSALVLIFLKVSWGILLLCQVGLFFGIGVFRALRDPS
ncbi:hypothetical protein LVB77_04520 [Lysobacter sp. 5GHs7-4]|uniref:hypothetical protein n=1 Tax=Lysobacter sp. 5GHs7-4 TaxID=2904253 RepID=UPI001E3C10CD|nr:hypothetical protein [Lysobacter sp. 5GHs7-4]UHQ23986.1 hypothetical protein LVB77_04520 [Lysobacter sp. 5GHs7-4]